jgi:glycosyltransferase involved in cell wall biosynthesis
MTVDAIGGVWRYAMDLGMGLRAAGVETVFAGSGPQPSAAQREEAAAIGTLAWLDAPLDWTAEREEELAPLPGLLAELVRSQGIDLVHLNLPSQGYQLDVPVPVVAVSHSCVVTWFHAVRCIAPPEAWAWQQRRNRAGFDTADAVLAPSRSHAEMLVTCYGPIAGLEVVHNAARGEDEADEREDYAFAAGRWWDEGKNAAALDQAAAGTAWPVVMAGPTIGPNGQSVSLNHADGIGEIANREVRRRMLRAGVVVSPSIYEPFGLAALEAARGGAPLVLADIPTYRELWDGAALFADPRDPGAFAAAIDRLAADPALREELGRAARQRSQRFTIAAQGAAVLDLYRRVFAKAAPSLAGVG